MTFDVEVRFYFFEIVMNVLFIISSIWNFDVPSVFMYVDGFIVFILK